MRKKPTEHPSLIDAAQLRAARAYLGMSQHQVADEAHLHRRTLTKLETADTVRQKSQQKSKRGSKETPRLATFTKLRAVFEAHGIEFLFQDGKPVGVRIRRR
jgi:DNA-binding XRE family transcriptional regulator